ncbi:TetR/AcrR family transcriptional regulator [Microbacterium sp. P06]|uniref:TetR/AcrR family transcriptional regulator n=1 Tax=Microbacterium sp. P06 TaxID=3366949 RepID=UPI003745D2EE
MPKVSDGYRAARREEIADAVLRRMDDVGYSRLSMADVFAEAGMSAGSVYSHFRSKFEIAVFVVKRLHDGFTADVRQWGAERAAAGEPVDPPTLTRWMLRRVASRRASRVPLLQLWAEATVHEPFRVELRRNMAVLRAELVAILRPWAEAQYPHDEKAAKFAARQAARGSLLVCAGFISQSAVYGDGDIDRYLATIRGVVGG